ncbi:MAG: microcystin-dependent protein [Myxococcota bacterium]|jgi:microcystin-dependent protein
MNGMLLRVVVLLWVMVGSGASALAQQEGMIGEIKMFGGNFAPRGWALCEGQLLPISQNTALFSLLGTTYGGDGRTTFALPDLRGRAPVQQGNGPGLQSVQLGERYGIQETSAVPPHSHALAVSSGNATTSAATGALLANPSLGGTPTAAAPAATARGFAPPANGSTPLSPAAVQSTGSGPVNVVGPRLGINYIIALQGVFPSRS